MRGKKRVHVKILNSIFNPSIGVPTTMAAARATILSAAHVTRPSRAQDDPIVPSLDQAILNYSTGSTCTMAFWVVMLPREGYKNRFFAKNHLTIFLQIVSSLE